MNKYILLSYCIVLLSSTLFPSSVQAQEESKITDFARPGRPTMMIYVWGTASTPGIWRVERDVDLVELLSAAQIANFGNSDATKRQTMYLSILRPSGTRRVEIYKAKMTDFLTESSQAPQLQEGDLLLIETITKQRFNLQTIFAAIGALASVVLLLIRIDQLQS